MNKIIRSVIIIMFIFSLAGCGEAKNILDKSDPDKETIKEIKEPEKESEKTDAPASAKPDKETAKAEETSKPAETKAPEKTETKTPDPAATIKPATAVPTETATNKPATAKPTLKPATTKPAATKTPKPATTKPATTPKPTKTAAATKKPAATATSRPAASSIPVAKTNADVEKYNKQGIKYKVGKVTVTPCTEKKAWADSGYIRPEPDSNGDILGSWVTAELRVTGICDNGYLQVRDVTVYPTGVTNHKPNSYYYTYKDFIQYEAPIWTKMRGYDPEEVCKKVLKKLKSKGHKIYGDDKAEDIKEAKADLKELEDDLPSDLERYKRAYEDGEITKEKYKDFCANARQRIQDKKDYIKYLENLDYINDSHEVEFDSDYLGRPSFFNQNLNRMYPYTWGFMEERGVKDIDDIVDYICSGYGEGRGTTDGKGAMAGYKKGESLVIIKWSRVDVPYHQDYLRFEKRYCFDFSYI